MDDREARDLERYREIIESRIAEGDDEARLAVRGLIALTLEIDGRSTTDSLTGLPNRRAMSEKDNAESAYQQSESRRTREPKATYALYIDLDKFKPINDTLGHEYGDRVLMIVGNMLRRSIRREDEIYRVGGDEFFMYGKLFGDIDAEFDPEDVKERFFNQLNVVKDKDSNPVKVGELLPEGMTLGERDFVALGKVGATFGTHMGRADASRAELLAMAEPEMRALREASPDDYR